MIKQRDSLYEDEVLNAPDQFFFSDVLECQSSEYLTPLLTAVKFDQYDSFELLTSVGAKLHVTCTKLNTPLHYAIMNKNLRFVKRLMYMDSDENQMLYAENARAQTPEDLDVH